MIQAQLQQLNEFKERQDTFYAELEIIQEVACKLFKSPELESIVKDFRGKVRDVTTNIQETFEKEFAEI